MESTRSPLGTTSAEEGRQPATATTPAMTMADRTMLTTLLTARPARYECAVERWVWATALAGEQTHASPHAPMTPVGFQQRAMPPSIGLTTGTPARSATIAASFSCMPNAAVTRYSTCGN